jgi:hypothetical protein
VFGRADEVWRRAEASARGKRRSQVRVTYGVGHLAMDALGPILFAFALL